MSTNDSDDSDASDRSDDRVLEFQRHRPRLFGIAYRMLGSVHDAEDAVQEAYLRWHESEADAVRSPEAWLVAVVTRICVDRLRRVATERAAYVGSWLPEPLATPTPKPDRQAELASELSIAFLVLLERLAPEERAAFLLREVFGAGYGEIAATLGKSEAACRQIVHRARERVRRGEQRFPPPPDAKERLLERFLAALAAEDKETLVSMLADDVVMVADGGGKAPAIAEEAVGAERVARLLVSFQGMARDMVEHRLAWLNGEPAVLTLMGGFTAFTTSLAAEGDRITAVYRVLNPDKLRHVGPPPILDQLPPGLRTPAELRERLSGARDAGSGAAGEQRPDGA